MDQTRGVGNDTPRQISENLSSGCQKRYENAVKCCILETQAATASGVDQSTTPTGATPQSKSSQKNSSWIQRGLEIEQKQ